MSSSTSIKRVSERVRREGGNSSQKDSRIKQWSLVSGRSSLDVVLGRETLSGGNSWDYNSNDVDGEIKRLRNSSCEGAPSHGSEVVDASSELRSDCIGYVAG